jgi:hypothetical protein
MHPQNQPRALGIGIGLKNRRANGVGCGEDRLENYGEGEFFAETASNRLRVDGDLLEGFGTLEVLAAGEEPDLGCFHFWD